MGARFRYSCTSCDYSVNVAGGISFGLREGRDTMVCRSCQSIVDVLIRYIEGRDQRDVPPHKERPFTCPECSSVDVEKWPHHKPCPKCGQAMLQQRGHVIGD